MSKRRARREKRYITKPAASDTISLTPELLTGVLSMHTDDVHKLATSSGKLVT